MKDKEGGHRRANNQPCQKKRRLFDYCLETEYCKTLPKEGFVRGKNEELKNSGIVQRRTFGRGGKKKHRRRPSGFPCCWACSVGL